MRYLFLLSLAVALLGITTRDNLAYARDTIECESYNYRYNHCRADTDGRVRLVRQTSDTACVQGRSWGYDRRGVWVDRGCAGVFRVGRDHDRHDDDNDIGNAAAAAAVIGGVAILGAALNSGDHHNHGYDRHSSYVPSWAIGRFEGYSPLLGSNVRLRINDSGKVVVRFRDRKLVGSYENGEIYLNGRRYALNRERGGLVARNRQNRRDVVHYRRL